MVFILRPLKFICDNVMICDLIDFNVLPIKMFQILQPQFVDVRGKTQVTETLVDD
jgi:hypothetical protein